MTTIHPGLGANGPAAAGAGSADQTQAAQSQTAAVQTPVTSSATTQSGEVQITPTAQLLATVEQQLAGTPEVNQGLVDSIGQALSNGSYPIDSARVADGLLAARKFDAQAAAASSAGAQPSPAQAFAATAQLGSDPAGQ